MRVYIQNSDVRSIEKMILSRIKKDREYLLTVTETKTSRNNAHIEQNVSSSTLEKVINSALAELTSKKRVPLSVRKGRNSLTVSSKVGNKTVTFQIKEMKGGQA